MFDLFNITKNKSGEVILSISIKNVQFLRNLFLSLDRFTHHRVVLFLVMALGFGFGIGITVFQTPSQISAIPAIFEEEKPTNPHLLEINSSGQYLIEEVSDLNTFFIQPSDKVVRVRNGKQLTDNGEVMLGVGQFSKLAEAVKNVSLSSQIQVVGDNNGVYNFSVIEIRHIDRDQISNLQNQLSETLIIIVPSNLLQTKLIAVVAR